MRIRVIGIALAVLIAIGTTAFAQEEIFSDGFEWGSTCAWSNDLWYPDTDIDLFGDDQAVGIQSDCPPPFGMVENNRDCDDGEYDFNPGATEVCDGLDNNCDGLEDNLDPQICYTGPPSTLGVGECSSGTQTCNAGFWGQCGGEILPTTEQCADGNDNDCDSSTDCNDDDCLGQVAPCLVDGQDCEATSDCLSTHCQNDFCCASGDCCSEPRHCPASYSLSPVCDSPSTCQGRRVDAVCTSHICGSGPLTDDDSGCGPGTLADDCALYPDLYCDGSVVQTPPTCSSSCADDTDCDLIAHCDDTTCQADLPNGSACDEASDCLSSHCDNEICCVSGFCCTDSSDCQGGMECVGFTCVSSK